MTTTKTAVLSDAPDRQTESNREIAIDFLTRAARGEARDAMRRYAAPDFVHHNPWFAPDAESLATAMDTNARENPQKELHVHHNPWFAPDAESLASVMDANARENPQKEMHVQRTIAEGPLVVVHASVQHDPGEQPAAVVHIFRFEDGRIRELWDIGQEAPADSPNTAGMF